MKINGDDDNACSHKGAKKRVAHSYCNDLDAHTIVQATTSLTSPILLKPGTKLLQTTEPSRRNGQHVESRKVSPKLQGILCDAYTRVPNKISIPHRDGFKRETVLGGFPKERCPEEASKVSCPQPNPESFPWNSKPGETSKAPKSGQVQSMGFSVSLTEVLARDFLNFTAFACAIPHDPKKTLA